MSKKQILFTSLGVVIIAAILISIYFLFLKPCDHEWLNATCENPATCKLCGETAGESLGHDWIDADCENPAICSACNLTRGSPLGHKWVDATCIIAKTCSICGKTEGEPLGHVWMELLRVILLDMIGLMLHTIIQRLALFVEKLRANLLNGLMFRVIVAVPVVLVVSLLVVTKAAGLSMDVLLAAARILQSV